MILCRAQMEEDFGTDVWDLGFKAMVTYRNKKEEEKLERCMNVEIPQMKLRDNMFRRFSAFVENELLEKNEDEVEVLLEECIERWGLWLKTFTEGFEFI